VKMILHASDSLQLSVVISNSPSRLTSAPVGELETNWRRLLPGTRS
jgi:hypothetical protein